MCQHSHKCDKLCCYIIIFNILILTYGYSDQNHLYMKVRRKHNLMRHIFSGLNAKELITTLLVNLVLLYIPKNFSLRIQQFISILTTLHLSIASLDFPPSPSLVICPIIYSQQVWWFSYIVFLFIDYVDKCSCYVTGE